MIDLDFTTLVNKDNPLLEDYIPTSLYIIDENEHNFHQYRDPSLKPMLRSDIKTYVDTLLEDAHKLGYPIIVDSGYRSFQYQQVVLDDLIAKKGINAYSWVAIPGASEHQTGLAMDVAYLSNGFYSDDVKETDKEAIWLRDNAYKYGFILRYPKGKESITGFQFEPWHFRFVGLELAQELYNNELTLEEHYTLKRKK